MHDLPPGIKKPGSAVIAGDDVPLTE